MPTLAAMRRTCDPDTDQQGQVRLLFIRDAARIGLVQSASENANHADQFLARYLADMIIDVGAPAVVVLVSRAEGRPTHSDRQLWAMLVDLLAPTTTTVLDLVAIGPEKAWSVRRSRPLNPPRRRPAVRRRRATRAGQPNAARKSASRATAP